MKKALAALLMVVVAMLTMTAGAVAHEREGHRTYAVKSVEVQIPSRGITIPATAVTPVAGRHDKFPLVVIHHGHGGGRNENGGLARVADALAKAGIASIRFDFPGAGDSTEPFQKLTYTNMLADSASVLKWAVRHMPVQKNRVGGFGYSEGSAVVALQAGAPYTPYQAVALLGPVAHPKDIFASFFGGKFDAYYAEAQANGYAVVTTPFGQVQNTSLEWFQETLQVDPAGELGYFRGRVELLWGESEQIIPYSQVEAFQAAAKDSAKSVRTVKIPNADHGYGFYSNQPDVDAVLHSALVSFFTKALHR